MLAAYEVKNILRSQMFLKVANRFDQMIHGTL